MTARSSSASSSHVVSARVVVGHVVLALILGARAAVNAAFAVWLWNVHPDRAAFFAAAITYLAADGVLALLATGVLMFGVLGEAPRLLIAATAADGLLRLVAALAFRAFPGLPDFPVTAVGFFGIIGMCGVFLALMAITIRLEAWRTRHRAHERTPLSVHEELDPIFVIGIVALGLAVFAFIGGPPVTAADYRALGIRWASILAGAFAVAAFGVLAARRAPPR